MKKKKRIKALAQRIDELENKLSAINEELLTLRAGEYVLNDRLFEQEANVNLIQKQLERRNNDE